MSIPRHDAKFQRPASNHRRESLAARCQRIDELLEGIRHNRPHWAALTPWEAELFLEPKQSTLWDLGGQQ